MPDTTNDINALLEFLQLASIGSYATIPGRVAADYRVAITALVAERDKLRDVLSTQIEGRDALVSERDALRERVAVGEMQLRAARRDAHWPADRDRSLRERLVCAALPAIVTWHASYVDAARGAVCYADATLAAMRKEDGNGK